MAPAALENTKETIAMRVVDALRDDIITMGLKPGDVISESDIAGRYGGEEYAVLLPDTDKYGAGMFAERLRVAVETQEVFHEGEAIRCSISLGVADMNSPLSEHKTLIEWADQALYASKKNGRNQVSLHEAG